MHQDHSVPEDAVEEEDLLQGAALNYVREFFYEKMDKVVQNAHRSARLQVLGLLAAAQALFTEYNSLVDGDLYDHLNIGRNYDTQLLAELVLKAYQAKVSSEYSIPADSADARRFENAEVSRLHYDCTILLQSVQRQKERAAAARTQLIQLEPATSTGVKRRRQTITTTGEH